MTLSLRSRRRGFELHVVVHSVRCVKNEVPVRLKKGHLAEVGAEDLGGGGGWGRRVPAGYGQTMTFSPSHLEVDHFAVKATLELEG